MPRAKGRPFVKGNKLGKGRPPLTVELDEALALARVGHSDGRLLRVGREEGEERGGRGEGG